MAKPKQLDTSELINTAWAAWYLKLSPETLRTWRSKGMGPRYYVIGRRAVRYLRADVERFALSQAREFDFGLKHGNFGERHRAVLRWAAADARTVAAAVHIKEPEPAAKTTKRAIPTPKKARTEKCSHR